MSQDSERPIDSLEPPEKDEAPQVDDDRPEIPPPPLTPADDFHLPKMELDEEALKQAKGGDAPPPKDELPLNRGWLHWLRVSLLMLSLFVCVALMGGFVGYVIGVGKTNGSMDYNPYVNYCGDSAASLGSVAMHRRNQVWRAWNGESVDETSSLIAALVVTNIDPDVGPLAEAIGKIALRDKWKIAADDAEEIAENMASASPMRRVQGFHDLVQNDAQIGEMIRQITCDQRRVTLFLRGRSIPLETMPDGTAP